MRFNHGQNVIRWRRSSGAPILHRPDRDSAAPGQFPVADPVCLRNLFDCHCVLPFRGPCGPLCLFAAYYLLSDSEHINVAVPECGCFAILKIENQVFVVIVDPAGVCKTFNLSCIGSAHDLKFFDTLIYSATLFINLPLDYVRIVR